MEFPLVRFVYIFYFIVKILLKLTCLYSFGVISSSKTQKCQTHLQVRFVFVYMFNVPSLVGNHLPE